MKVLMLNGSAKKEGNTYQSLLEVGKELERQGIEYEIFQIGSQPVRDCIGSAIPKSVNPERIAENADIFDFELTDMEMKTIDALDEKFRSAGIPEDMQGFVI